MICKAEPDKFMKISSLSTTLAGETGRSGAVFACLESLKIPRKSTYWRKHS